MELLNKIDKYLFEQLEGKSKQSAKNFIYSKMGNQFNGIYSDNSWIAVSNFWKFLKGLGADVTVGSSEYGHDSEGKPNRKVWQFTASFKGKEGKEIELKGNLTASGAGSVKDPLDKYDISVVIF